MNVLRLTIFLVFVCITTEAQNVISRYSSKQLSVTLTIDTSKCSSTYNSYVSKIDITSKLTGKHLTLPNFKDSNSVIPCSDDIMKSGYFQIADANFDGYDDILLLQFLPAAPNLPYFWWIYNPASKSFVEDTALENITSPQFDSVKHQITSFWRASCCDHGLDTYSYSNGKAILIHQEEDIADPNGTAPDTLIERKVIAGKLTEVSRKAQKQ